MLRVRQRLRQEDLARAVGVSQTLISRVERGQGERLTCATIGRICARLGARLTVRVDWNGEALDRLLDAGHAGLVAQLAEILGTAGWAIVPEATFAIGGERGSVDVLAWHEASASVLIVEVKSVVPDIQGMLAPLDRK